MIAKRPLLVSSLLLASFAFVALNAPSAAVSAQTNATLAATVAATSVATSVSTAMPTLASTSVATSASIAATSAPVATGSGVTQVHGTVKITNQFALGDTAEPMIALIDLTAYIKQDHDLRLPYADQTVAGVYTDPTTGQTDLSKGAQYTMPLPIEPRGSLNNVASGKGGQGVMTFALDFDTNAIGDGFMGPYEWSGGWPGGADGLEFDPGTYEIAQGKFMIWAPDNNQYFPTGFGADGKLFTADDPVAPVQQGWTLVTVDADHTKPLTFTRDAHVEVPMLEGLSANNDLSNLSYTAAFDELVKELKLRYVHTAMKKLDFTALSAQIRPLVAQAEKDKSTDEFNIAILKFSAAFHDGHVATQPPQNYFSAQAGGGLGLDLGQLSDGTIVIDNVIARLPAAQAGIKVGAVVTQWNGQPITKAVAATPLLFDTQSSPIPTFLSQLRFITRSVVGTDVKITYQNPGDSAPTTTTLTSVQEGASFNASSPDKGVSATDMPLTWKVIQQNGKFYGYIKINTFETDSVLLTRLWENALSTFSSAQVPNLIVDVRQNGGGSGLLATYFAGSFYTNAFTLNENYGADVNGKFIYGGKTQVLPSPTQWTAPVAIMVGPACASACEIFAASVAHDTTHLIVGHYPTAGIEASVEAWTLPDGLYFQAPTGKLTDPGTQKDFLEGVGVPPNVKVPVTLQSLTSGKDDELAAAEAALDKVTPSGN